MPPEPPAGHGRVLPIVMHPDPRLGEPCAPVGAPDEAVRDLAEDMLATMYAAPGRGLAAPQVGVLRRIFVMDVSWKDGAPAPVVMIDPVVEEAGAEAVEMEEACLSIPGEPRTLSRPAEVVMSWTEPDGARTRRRLTGLEARCAQHELDHLDGILILDRAGG